MANSPIIFGANNTANNLQSGLSFVDSGSGATASTILSGSVNPSSVATLGNPGSLYLNDSSGVVYIKQDSGSTTNWAALTASSSFQYAQAYFNSGYNWTTSSTSFVTPTNTSTGTFTVRRSSGITVTAAASNQPGVTFTPASTSAVYLIQAQVAATPATSAAIALQLYDGTTIITSSPTINAPGITSNAFATLVGIYAPNTTSAVTINVQVQVAGGSGSVGINPGYSNNNAIEFIITRIDSITATPNSNAASAYCSVNNTPGASLPFNFDTKEFDPNNLITTGASWKFTAPVTGVYEILMQANSNTASNVSIVLYKNGSAYKTGGFAISSGGIFYNTGLQLNAGDYIDIRPSSSITIAGGALSAAGGSTIFIKQI